MENLKILFTKYQILRDKDKDSYYVIKDNAKKYEPFIKEKLGYNLIIKGDFIKLEKLPGNVEDFMGIEEFTDKKEYVFLMIILTFLEDKGKEEQFLLSHITEFISSNTLENQVDWTNYYTRRCLIKVLKFCLSMDIIMVNDGNEDSFMKDSSREILFESTGLSKYMVRSFNQSIDEKSIYEQIINEELSDVEVEKGIFRRQRVYRDLLIHPIVYRDEERPEDYEYIRTYRNIISQDFEKYLGLKLQVHKNGALLLQEAETSFNVEKFPRNNALHDIIVIVCNYLNDKIRNDKENLLKDDSYKITIYKFQEIIKKVIDEKGSGFSKEFREGNFEKNFTQIKNYMKRIKIIGEKEEEIIIYPLCGKISGDFSKDYLEKQRKDKVDKDEQMAD